MASRFDGKVAVVTGGASGIGAATARRFAAEGARVMIADINEDGGAALAAELGKDVAEFRRTDVQQLPEIDGLMQAAVDRFGRLDVLFNNAGVGTYGKTPDLEPEAWHAVIAVDLHAVFYGCRAAIPYMRKFGGGAIVNTASISGLGADYGLCAYNAAKGAVVNYTRSLAIDHARENIRVNSVSPGAIDTPLIVPLTTHPVVMGEYERLVPMGRVGRPEEVAAVVVFLASEDASYVTGATVVVDGGVLAATGQPNFTRIIEGG